jgi:hypothetical protein
VRRSIRRNSMRFLMARPRIRQSTICGGMKRRHAPSAANRNSLVPFVALPSATQRKQLTNTDMRIALCQFEDDAPAHNSMTKESGRTTPPAPTDA